ncbi:MAG: 50S ribosomal protein L11 methyltransferase [Bacteroidia bacterium]|nr:50S ribosomal protein L11 methyltransferase [Bacteroidia bacterium]
MSTESTLDEARKRLEEKYDLKHFTLKLGDRDYHLASIANVDKLLDDIITQGPGNKAFDDEQIAYWAELWHAAIGMAEMIESGKVVKPEQKVMEVGCGMGLCGIAAAFQGGKVVLTDYLPEALELARYNWLLNHSYEPDCRLLDWRIPQPDWKTDILMASDVAYEARAFDPLVNFFHEMIVENGEIWLSEPGRSFSQSWISQLTNRGFYMEKFTKLVILQEIECKVGVYKLTLA